MPSFVVTSVRGALICGATRRASSSCDSGREGDTPITPSDDFGNALLTKARVRLESTPPENAVMCCAACEGEACRAEAFIECIIESVSFERRDIAGVGERLGTENEDFWLDTMGWDGREYTEVEKRTIKIDCAFETAI